MYLRPAAYDTNNGYREPAAVWGEPVTLRAVVQPAGGRVNAQVYGAELATMRVLYYAGIAEMKPGDGVCVDVGPADSPDYTITSVEPWNGHRRAMLAFVPEGKREI
jgi:hypothetical protein